MPRNLDKSRIPSQDMGMTSSYGKEVTLTLCRECGEAELLKNVSICWCIYNIRAQWFYQFGSPGPLVVANVVLRHIYWKNYRFFCRFENLKMQYGCKTSHAKNEKVTENRSFWLLLLSAKVVCLYFFWVIFCTFFNRIKLSIKFAFYVTHIKFLKK